jgi:hypothetical protein
MSSKREEARGGGKSGRFELAAGDRALRPCSALQEIENETHNCGDKE